MEMDGKTWISKNIKTQMEERDLNQIDENKNTWKRSKREGRGQIERSLDHIFSTGRWAQPRKGDKD